MGLAVSNSTVLINLSTTQLLPLLPHFFNRIVIPPAVWVEITTSSKWTREAESFRAGVAAGWLQTIVPQPQTQYLQLPKALGPGESEAILLAAEMNTLLLMDDLAARDFARSQNLHVTGTLGILLRAKKIGKIAAVKPVLQQLIFSKAFRISSNLLQHFLHSAGED